MKVQDLVTQIQSELDDREQKLVTRTIRLDQRGLALDSREDGIQEVEQGLVIRVQELDQRESAIGGEEERQGRLTLLQSLTAELEDTKTEQRKKENDLADIQAGIKQREAEVIKREQAVSAREETYKQTIKDEFYAEVNKRLPH